jgi:ATP-binding cassette subfamily B protein
MKKAFKYFTPYILWLAALVVLVWGQSHVNLTLPDYMAKIINDGILAKNNDKVLFNGLQMLLWTLFGGVCAVAIGFIASRISTGYIRKLREAVFIKVEQFSLSEFDGFSSSSLITRATNDMQQIQNVMSMVLRMAFLAPFIGVGSVIKAYDIAPSMSWIVITAVGAIVFLIVLLFFIAIPKFTQIQKMVDKLSLQTREMLTGVRVIRAYNNDDKQQQKFNVTNIESTKLNIFVNRLIMLMQPMMTLIMGLSSTAVIWAGAYAIKAGDLQVGNLFALMQYISQTIIAFLMISIIFIMVPRATVSIKRVAEVLSVNPRIIDPVEVVKLPKDIKGVIEFKNVNFGYKTADHLALENISFTAEPGQTTAIIGGTGSGKSSILKLIPRLYDVSTGSIMIDGIDIRNLTQKDLHSVIGYVPQKASLFSGTISSNISYGNPKADEAEINNVAKIAQAKEFIDALPEKLGSLVAQAGNNLSGGQKQRLSIARVLVKNPAIYLFDDSFSALDFKTDSALRQALEREVKNKTFIVVAQRVSTIMNAEKIITIEDGKVVGVGTHKQLLRTCNVYREIAESQLSATELEEGI